MGNKQRKVKTKTRKQNNRIEVKFPKDKRKKYKISTAQKFQTVTNAFQNALSSTQRHSLAFEV